MVIMNPSININGTSKEELVNTRRNVLDKIDELMKAMQETKPHGRDYVGRAYQYDLDRKLYTERFTMLDKLRNEIMDEALDIHNKK